MTKNSSDIENKTDVSIAGMLAYRWFDEETPQHILFALHAIMTQESFDTVQCRFPSQWTF